MPFTGFTGKEDSRDFDRIRRELVVQFPVDELPQEFKRSRENRRPPILRYGWVVYDPTGIFDYAMSRMKQYGIRPTRKLPENYVPRNGTYASEFLDVRNILVDESGVFDVDSTCVAVANVDRRCGFRVEAVEKLGSLLGLQGRPQWYLADDFDLRPTPYH